MPQALKTRAAMIERGRYAFGERVSALLGAAASEIACILLPGFDELIRSIGSTWNRLTKTTGLFESSRS
jgi:hypothetical protein